MKRRGRGMALLVVAMAPSACGLVFDFDHYDTSNPPAEPVFGDSTLVEGTQLDLVVPDALTIEPGTTAALPVTVQRYNNDIPHDANDGRVVVSVTGPSLGGMPIADVFIDPGASMASLSIDVGRTMPPGVVQIQVVATDGVVTRTKNVALTLRGPACNVDRGFGPDATGALHVTQLQPPGLDEGFFVAVSDQAITVASLDPTPEEPRVQIRRFDHDGNLVWTALPDAHQGLVAVDADAGVYVLEQGIPTRYFPNGDVDDGFQNGTPPACEPVAFDAFGAAPLAMLCPPTRATRNWALSLVDGTGQSAPEVGATFDPPVTGPIAVHAVTGGYVACGSSLDRLHPQAAFSRWAADGGVDPSFGDGGATTLASGTDVDDCLADDAGIVSLGGTDAGLAVAALRVDGQPDPAYGDGGVRSFALPDAAAPQLGSSRVVANGGALFALVAPAGGASLLARFDRATGKLDTTFGAGGYCNLAALGLSPAAGLALTPDGKVVILANGIGELIVARLWL